MPIPQPILKTPRLILRPCTLADAPAVQRLAGDREIAATTLNIPHPYERKMAEEWIASHPQLLEENKQVIYGITLASDGAFVGTISLSLKWDERMAELGYWIGRPYWNRGYCTEAARAIVEYGFIRLNLHRIFAHHLTRNPASGRVMQKLGMQHEGHLRQHILKWGVFEDVEVYGLLREEFISRRGK
ncbi:MAG: N-acetyltransferase [Calditrichaeota bacterium]|nr:MAG: N-acetyltransferase [Calditrichota bacterium]